MLYVVLVAIVVVLGGALWWAAHVSVDTDEYIKYMNQDRGSDAASLAFSARARTTAVPEGRMRPRRSNVRSCRDRALGPSDRAARSDSPCRADGLTVSSQKDGVLPKERAPMCAAPDVGSVLGEVVVDFLDRLSSVGIRRGDGQAEEAWTAHVKEDVRGVDVPGGQVVVVGCQRAGYACADASATPAASRHTSRHDTR